MKGDPKPGRKPIPEEVTTQVLLACRRRCCLCFHLNHDATEKAGQIAHVDRNPANNHPDNLAFLCLPHHNTYDSRPSQSKGLTPGELVAARDALIRSLETPAAPQVALERVAIGPTTLPSMKKSTPSRGSQSRSGHAPRPPVDGDKPAAAVPASAGLYPEPPPNPLAVVFCRLAILDGAKEDLKAEPLSAAQRVLATVAKEVAGANANAV